MHGTDVTRRTSSISSIQQKATTYSTVLLLMLLMLLMLMMLMMMLMMLVMPMLRQKGETVFQNEFLAQGHRARRTGLAIIVVGFKRARHLKATATMRSQIDARS
jgi:hypothetical protein